MPTPVAIHQPTTIQIQNRLLLLGTPRDRPAMTVGYYVPGSKTKAAAALVVPIPPLIAVEQPGFDSEIRAGLLKWTPEQTKSGINGSFFLADSTGKKCAVFKPMGMEAGGPKNHRLDAEHNVQFRRTILPGQGAGNEVLAYALDKNGLGGRYGIPETILIRLEDKRFEGEELGSAQRFLPNTKTLLDMTPEERAQIPQSEWEKLNFRFISGGTDTRYGNILYNSNSKKLYLIDSGDDFVGSEGQDQYLEEWVTEPRAKKLMSDSEYEFLAHLDAERIMNAFETQAKANAQQSPILRVSTDKHLTQLLRIKLAQVAGEFKLSQAEWFDIMTRRKPISGGIAMSDIEVIFNQFIKGHFDERLNWKIAAEKNIDWKIVRNHLEYYARMRLNSRSALR